MKINYNAWFFNQHKYRTSKRDNVESFTDTKWYNINERFKNLMDMESELLNEQPGFVQANNKGFDMLLDLLGRSNYTFEDLDSSLKETYRVSLQNTMSRNVVNTHAIMYHIKSDDKRHVSSVNFTNYKVIDAPFNQLHFGHRDEFIRQKIHEMHITENNHFIDIGKFNSSEIADVLDFCILCTINGFISNDCKVAIDDHGFKFQIGCKTKDVVDFVIYKLDRCKMITVPSVSTEVFKSMTIPYDTLGINGNNVKGQKCLVNIYNSNYKTTITTAPNFGVFTDTGLQINNLQEFTKAMYTNSNMKNVSLDIYALKYLHEIPNIYPAVNYYDIMESKLVYDDKYERLRTPDGGLVVESSSSSTNDLELCTPPITIDRDTSYTFDSIVSCLHLYDDLITYKQLMSSVGEFMLNPTTMYDFDDRFIGPLKGMYSQLIVSYSNYMRGATITSLVPIENIRRFDSLVEHIRALIYDFHDINDSQVYGGFDELYGNNYEATVLDIAQPFMNDKLLPFRKINGVKANFFEKESATRFNRPISEQSFISLQYSDEYRSWIFAYPDIKHFHGIGNTFYIDTGLTGNEVFKFFVLYTDTEDPANPYIEHFDLKTVIDFDLFYDEMSKYMGCIRYWDAENKLAKLSRMLYRRYDDETCIHVLSKILKDKIECGSILNDYPSEINYEPSNITSDNVNDYDENSDRGPFSVNFLFYTLSMLNDNVDKLQAYFYRDLTNKKFSNRYADVDVSSVIDGNPMYPLSFSQYTISPSSVPDDHIPTDKPYMMFYGLPLLLDSVGTSSLYNPYRYVLNVYDPDVKYPYIDTHNLSDEYFVQFEDIDEYYGAVISYKETIEYGRLLTTYLDAVYDCISELQTNYKKSFNCTSVCDRYSTYLQTISDELNELYNSGKVDSIAAPVDVIINAHVFQDKLELIKRLSNDILFMDENTNVIKFFNVKVLQTIRKVHMLYGFDDDVDDRVHALYDHLRKINKPMNPYQFKKWLSNIDMHILETLDEHVAYNENYAYGDDMFYTTIYQPIKDYMDRLDADGTITLLDSTVKGLSGQLFEDEVRPIIDLCNQIFSDVIFDTYTYETLTVPGMTSGVYNSEPNVLILQLPMDAHTTAPFGPSIPGTHNLFFKIDTQLVNSQYKISSVSNICEYVFFDGTPLTGITAIVLSETGSVIDTISDCEMTFIRAGSTADTGGSFNQLPNTGVTVLDFENHHETFEVVNDRIVNEKTAPMNYELLIGNNFLQLDHISEYILNPATWNPGSIDRIFINNQDINRMCIDDHGHKVCSHVFFKPCQVIHPAESVNGKYFEGETVYLKTPEGFIFPTKVTSVDHSMNKGFMELEVDQWDSTWFEATDSTMIAAYMNDVVECTVIDDNVRNFLDEYSDTTLNSYYQPPFDSSVMDDDHVNCYTLPGDPLTVTTGAHYIYSRLVWMFNEDISNRFIDDESKKYRFIYIGEGYIPNGDDNIMINMINHDYNDMTLPEKYPVLKDEPNEHRIWNKEIETFEAVKNDAQIRINHLNEDLMYAEEKLHECEGNIYEYKMQLNVVDGIKDVITYNENLIDRMNRMLYQLEPTTTWFNVISNEAALVYITNGRAEKYSPSFISDIRDLLYTDRIKVYLYDWEHKHWIDPSTYSISYEVEDGVKIDECDDYTTDRVMTRITITPEQDFTYSNKILVYFAYDKSDIFDGVEMNANTCNVRFKPALILDKGQDIYKPYGNIRIRKHFDGYEKYSTKCGDDASIHIKRIKRSGKYNDSPVFRLRDVSVHDTNGDHTYEDIHLLKIKSPFTGLTTTRKFVLPTYSTTITAPIDSFVENEHIKLICISNNENSSYDGNISSVMFEGTTSLSGTTQVVTITDSTLPNYITGTFICTVFKDDAYDSCGGVVVVTVSNNQYDIYDDWITVPAEFMVDHELPDEFKIVMNNAVMNTDATVTLENRYIKESNDTIVESNQGINKYEYYYDSKNHKRLPISDVKRNAHDRRLVIDTTLNEDVKLVKSTYIGICRYSLAKIPDDGIIDMTGFLPTPLSRNRYEFWVNGRYIKAPEDIIILSPTSIQLCNLRSLRNFECIELVDDLDTDNDLMHKGTTYIDINGNTFSEFKLAMLSNSKIRKQNLAYIFNANNNDSLTNYWRSISDPNNVDIEEDILSSITFDDSNTDYNQLFNIPTINGISLFHPKLSSLGIVEVPGMDIIKEFDKVWKTEAGTNPFFPMTHRAETHLADDNAGLVLHATQITEPDWHGLDIDTTGMFKIYTTGPVEKYFTLYVSRTIDGEIDDTTNTLKIIPFMTSSSYVLLDSQYRDMYLHSTYPNTEPIHLV